MGDIAFLKQASIKGSKVYLYTFIGTTGKWYEILTDRGTAIQKRFQKSPYFFATLSKIKSWRKLER